MDGDNIEVLWVGRGGGASHGLGLMPEGVTEVWEKERGAGVWSGMK